MDPNSSRRNDGGTSEESDWEPLWDSSEDSDDEESSPPAKKARTGVDCESTASQDSENGTIMDGTDSMSIAFGKTIPSSIDDREPYEIRIFENLKDVIAFMDHYQQETMTHFTSFSRQGSFGDEKSVPDVHKGRIYFESLKGKCGMPIAYDGVPYVHIGRWSFGCHQGVDRNLKQKELYHRKRKEKFAKEGIKIETRNRMTKKVNCPAEIYISHIVKFPEHRVAEDITSADMLPSGQVRRGIKKKLSDQYKSNRESLVCRHLYYVRIPQPWAHKGHPVISLNSNFSCVPSGTKVTLNTEAVNRMYNKRKNTMEGIEMRTKEPVDPRILEKIRSCYKEGITQEKEIRQIITNFVKEELFPGRTPPSSIYRRYNPAYKDITNEISKLKLEMKSNQLQEQKQYCNQLMTEISHMLPSVEDENVMEQLNGQLSQLYEITRMCLPEAHLSVEEAMLEDKEVSSILTTDHEQIVTTVDSNMENASSSSILLSSEHQGATIVIPQGIAVHHHQAPSHITHHTLSGAPHSATLVQQPIYQNYTVENITPITGINMSTLNAAPLTHQSVSSQPAATYEISTIAQQPQHGVTAVQPHQYATTIYRSKKITNLGASTWYG